MNSAPRPAGEAEGDFAGRGPQGESPGRISKDRWRSPRRTARARPVEVGCSNLPTNASWERATVPNEIYALYRVYGAVPEVA